MKFPNTIRIKPTTSGNGFIKGIMYEAHKCKSNYEFSSPLYEVLINNNKKIISYPNGEPSPHLWDGRDWNLCGKFELVGEQDD